MALKVSKVLADTVDDALPDALGGQNRPALLDLLPRGVTREGVALDLHIREGRFQRSLSLIAGLSGLLSGLEVLTEHYRGSYSQRVMYSPIILSPALLIAGVWGAFSRRAARTVLPVVSLITIADGVIGFVFHVRGIHRKPGGWRIPVFNLVMGPPVLAPLLFALSGYLGLIATFLRREDDPRPPMTTGPSALAARGRSSVTTGPSALAARGRAGVALPGTMGEALPARPGWLDWLPRGVTQEGLMLEQHVREGQFQKQLAAAAAVSAVLSGFEALYSHYKNNFRYKAQWTPILLTPLLCAAGIGAIWSRTIARTALPFVSILALLDGAVGTFYHVRGMRRRPGGFRYPLYNLMYGPPAFAPLLFAASGFLGLLASLLRRAD